jgi:hypothetical protein
MILLVDGDGNGGLVDSLAIVLTAGKNQSSEIEVLSVILFSLINSLINIEEGKIEFGSPGVVECTQVEDGGGEVVVHLLDERAGEGEVDVHVFEVGW